MTLINIVIYIESMDSDLLAESYAKIGVNWLKIDDELLYYSCKKVIFLLNKNNAQNPATKLFFFTDTQSVKEFGASNLTLASFEQLQASINNLDILKAEQNPNKQIIPILRVKDIEETRMDYQNFGEWVKQKHGSGPEHYALEDNGCVDLEIYPARKTPKGDIELFFN
ncbi:MAG: hypothetical protein K9G11_02505, partial [Rickettsiaceae bacterium]|nr:hypothetical protein [Rickettsiaceae bacterium]